MFSQKVTEAIENATGRALATFDGEQVNVVPVSMASVQDGKVWLFDFFMQKTKDNVLSHKDVSLACWNGLVGVQLKAEVEYVTSGPDFDAAVVWVAERNPSRVVKGLLVLAPHTIFDVSPGGAFSIEELQITGRTGEG